MRTAYISGPLQAADDLERWRSFYRRLAAFCAEAGWAAYLPHTKTDPERDVDIPAANVFKKDRGALIKSDVVVACIGVPSSGVGAEVAIAITRGQPVIGLWHMNERPSRFVQGMLQECPSGQSIAFAGEGDLRRRLRGELARIGVSSTAR